MPQSARGPRKGAGRGGRVRAPGTAGALALSLALAPAACGDGPMPAPGPLTVRLVSPNGAEGAAVVTLVGPGLGAVGALEGRVFSEVRADTVRVVVVNQAGGTLRFTIDVADTTRRPVGTLVEVAGPDDRIRPAAGYTLEIRP